MSSFSASKVRSVSSPGKALVAGGYLVLEHPNIGITVSCSSRFYVTISDTDSSPASSASSVASPSNITIVVDSPQFRSQFLYSYDIAANTTSLISASGNEFVEKCIILTLYFIREFYGVEKFTEICSSISASGKSIGIKLRADNDFYSQISKLNELKLPRTSSSLSTLDRFIACPLDPVTGELVVAKTGMGSSAAMTTSLVAALLYWFEVVSISGSSSEEDLRIIHNLSQLAHAIAQGKIGSGFDVASAVYGTQLYRRFIASNFTKCMEKDVTSREIFDAVIDKSLWTQTIDKCSLPDGLNLIMGDVCGGSSSVSMAREVLKWKATKKAEADALWAELSAANSEAYSAISKLRDASSATPEVYKRLIEWTSDEFSANWHSYSEESDCKTALLSLRDSLIKSRQLLRKMGNEAGVEIIPDSQLEIIDATESRLKGVLFAGVPGAGGFDAIFALYVSKGNRDNIESLWSTWSLNASVICPLMLQDEKVNGGARVEADLLWD
jgi:phosphomevalonate kinase